MHIKYRAKLYLSLLSVAFIASLLGIAIDCVTTIKHIREHLRERVSTLAATTSSLIPPSLIEDVIEKGEASPAYGQLVRILTHARDANRQTTFYVQYLYIVRVSPKDPSQIIFVVDAEENPLNRVHFGEEDPVAEVSDLEKHLDEPYAPTHFIKGKRGTWMTGFAPIFAEDGTYLASVGADVSSHVIQAYLNSALLYGLLALASSSFIAILGAHFLSKEVTESLSSICSSVKMIGEGNLKHEMHLNTHDEFDDLAEAINLMTKGLRERESLKVNFAKYVSYQVLDKIMKTGSTTKVEGERRKITVLFSDIRQFTALSEELPPEQVVRFLNEYFAAMIDIIFANQGTLDKFIGDGLMVEFGAPLEDPDQEFHAVKAAVEMQNKLSLLREKWGWEGKPQIHVGIGIHTGFAIVGNIGSEKRMEYTAIGDTVNIAARLEQTTKHVNMPILISEDVYKVIKDKFSCQSLGLINLKGRSKDINVYAISEKSFE